MRNENIFLTFQHGVIGDFCDYVGGLMDLQFRSN